VVQAVAGGGDAGGVVQLGQLQTVAVLYLQHNIVLPNKKNRIQNSRINYPQNTLKFQKLLPKITPVHPPS
jgi:hypothetical protein